MSTDIGDNAPGPAGTSDVTYLGGDTYTPFFLRRVYDPLVIRFANRWAWGCPSAAIVRMYRQHTSAAHLDIGPGTGWFLDHAGPPPGTRIRLLDPNPAVLAESGRRLQRYEVTDVPGDILRPLPEPIRTDPPTSVAMTHVLHCLPGPFERKLVALDHVVEALADGGVFFGSTVLGTSAPHTRFSRGYLDYMNESGVFANADDSESGLRDALAERFTTSHVHRVGVTALFLARV